MDIERRRTIIVNPNAGGAENARSLLQACAADTLCDVRETTAEGDARRFAREAVERGDARIIAAGGDGTINEVLNGIAPDFARIEFAAAPVGTGNDLARSLDLPLNDPVAAIELALSGETRPADVASIEAGGAVRYFLNACSGGVGPHIMEQIDPEIKKEYGRFAYWLAGVRELADPPVYRMRVGGVDELADVALEVHGIAIANGCFIGGGVSIAPAARLDDGLFDVIVLPRKDFLAALDAAVEVLQKQHTSGTGVLMLRARAVEVASTPPMPFNVDGEAIGEHDAVFRMLPKSLNVVCGPQPAGFGLAGAATATGYELADAEDDAEASA